MATRKRIIDGRLRTAALFTVEGDGRFPLDMLRYDACWPHWERDALAAQSTGDHDAARRCVVLETHRVEAPTVARWASFGWRVVGMGDLREKAR